MKKRKPESADWLRPGYRRSDFGAIVRGKYVDRIRAESNVIILDPKVAKVFPNDKAVNAALRRIIKAAKTSTRDASREHMRLIQIEGQRGRRRVKTVRKLLALRRRARRVGEKGIRAARRYGRP